MTYIATLPSRSIVGPPNASARSIQRPTQIKASSRAFCWLALFRVVAACFMVLAYSSAESANVSSGLEDDVATISDFRSRCEALATQIKINVPVGDHRYAKAEQLYGQAKAAGDAWLNLILFRLAAGDRPTSQAISQARQRFVVQAQSFVNYGNSLFPAADRGAGAAIVEVVAPVLADIGIKLWEAWEKAEEARRQALKEEINDLRLRPFDKL